MVPVKFLNVVPPTFCTILYACQSSDHATDIIIDGFFSIETFNGYVYLRVVCSAQKKLDFSETNFKCHTYSPAKNIKQKS